MVGLTLGTLDTLFFPCRLVLLSIAFKLEARVRSFGSSYFSVLF